MTSAATREMSVLQVDVSRKPFCAPASPSSRTTTSLLPPRRWFGACLPSAKWSLATEPLFSSSIDPKYSSFVFHHACSSLPPAAPWPFCAPFPAPAPASGALPLLALLASPGLRVSSAGESPPLSAPAFLALVPVDSTVLW